MNSVIGEIVDDQFNQDVIVFENQYQFEKNLIDRGLNVIYYKNQDKFQINQVSFDAALISINLHKDNNSIIVSKVAKALSQFNEIKKIYLLVSSDAEQNYFSKIKLLIKIKFFEKKINNQKFNHYKYGECETLHIIFNNDKVQQILPNSLIKDFFKRSWKINSIGNFKNLQKSIKFIFFKFSLFRYSSNIIIVFECEK